MTEYHDMKIAEILCSLPQPQLSVPVPDPAQPPARAPDQPPALDPAPTPATASTSVTAPVVSTSNQVPEHLMHKNRLQEYTQRSNIELPIYQTHNEGFQHAPKFRASVLVDGVTYTSPNTFSHRKEAEQDVAKIALDGISQKIKDEGFPLINEDTIFCKSILNEFAVKMNLEMPVYSTRQSEALLPVFVSSLFFNGSTYTGEAGRNKKEAEQLAARAVIRSLLVSSGSTTLLSEIIKSKVKLYAALNKVKEPNYSTQANASSYLPTAAIPVSSTAMHPTAAISISSTGMLPTAAIPQASIPIAAIPSASARMHATTAAPVSGTEMYMPHHQFMIPKSESFSEGVTLPISFVPPILGQPSGVGPSSTNKRRKNKKKANKKLRTDAQLCVAAQPSSQFPPCSVAQ